MSCKCFKKTVSEDYETIESRAQFAEAAFGILKGKLSEYFALKDIEVLDGLGATVITIEQENRMYEVEKELRSLVKKCE